MEWFDDLQRAQLEGLRRSNPTMAAWIANLDALYLYGTIGSEAVLLRNGIVRIWRADDWPESDAVSERDATAAERIGALVLGARRMPALAALLPTRPPSTGDCRKCEGSGEILGGVLCPDCSGLGWLSQAI